MCQLLGMNGNVPTDIRFSFSGFRQRGGRTDCHADGWGIAFFEGAGCRQILDPAPAGESKLAELVAQAPIRSRNVVAHIRKATQGPVQLENTHPFVRELWGRYWAFAHNGHLEDFAPPDSALRGFRPVGTTDSERAFCFLLSALRERFAEMPPRAVLLEQIASLTREIAYHGSFHYLLSNGDFLLAHSTENLAYVVREAPFGTAHLVDEDLSVDFRALTTPEDRVAVIATTPLTDDETWTPIAPGELVLFVDGAPVELASTTACDARFAA
ncbi:MAG: class II glutamine amidotransferase [Myxococcota bacterium]